MPTQSDTPKRRISQAPVKTIACYGGCGTIVEFRTTPRVYCPACKLDQKRASARVAMEKQRRKHGIQKIKGTEVKCVTCGMLFELNRSTIAKFCSSCAPDAHRERARNNGYKRNRAKGREEIGSVKSCAHCGCEFIKEKKGVQKYCEACMELSRANKLPLSRAAISAWRKKRKAADPKFALNELMRNGLGRSLGKGGKAGRPWESLVGYNVEQLKRHLERQFTRLMSWENRGTYWEIDHVQPISLFIFASADDPEFMAAWALSNLRPLPKTENYEKRAKRTLLL